MPADSAAVHQGANASMTHLNVPQVQFFEGTGEFTKVAGASVTGGDKQPGGDGVSLTFKNTDVRIIIQAVLGDTLQKSYSVDPRVQGTATLETSTAISKEAVEVALEAMLRAKGYAVIPLKDGLHILPISEAPRNVESIRYQVPASADLPGFAVHVVSMRYTAPSEMQNILRPFAPEGGIIRADDMRNLLIIAGTSTEITAMLQTIDTFDVDWMAGMSFAIFSLQYAEAEQLGKELSELFENQNRPTKGRVQFVPIPRINKIIAFSPQKKALEDVEFWVAKLDLGDNAPGQRIYVYRVKNGRAVDLANTLNQVMGFRSSGQFDSMNRNQSTRGSTRETSSNNSAFSQGLNGDTRNSSVRIVPNEENNSIVIMATPVEFGVIETALRQMDIMPRQVLVEVTIAEVTLTDELRYGLKWNFEFGDNTVALGASSQLSNSGAGFSWAHTNGTSVSALLSAIESVTDVNVISSPKLMVLNNHSASLQMGDEVPVPVSTSVSTTSGDAPLVNSIQYRSTGILLNVTPRINDGGLIMLDIEQEVSDVVETASSGIDAPTIQQRKITSSVAVQNGTTVALGGLIRRSLSNVNSGVPILKNIPLLGAAFKDKDVVERRSELIVILTPRVVTDANEQQDVMNYLQKEFKALISRHAPAPQEQ